VILLISTWAPCYLSRLVKALLTCLSVKAALSFLCPFDHHEILLRLWTTPAFSFWLATLPAILKKALEAYGRPSDNFLTPRLRMIDQGCLRALYKSNPSDLMSPPEIARLLLFFGVWSLCTLFDLYPGPVFLPPLPLLLTKMIAPRPAQNLFSLLPFLFSPAKDFGNSPLRLFKISLYAGVDESNNLVSFSLLPLPCKPRS